MVVFPGWVPLRSGYIEFDHLDPLVVHEPDDARLRAWPKVSELERRWLHFEWFALVAAKTRRGMRTLLDDAASAYLMTFEATLQVISDELFAGNGQRLRAWLDSHRPDPYDLGCRGLRTLRHVEAHVQPGSLEVVGDQRAHSVFAGSSWGETLPWCFPRLTLLPRSPALDLPDELDAWNDLVGTTVASSLMRQGVQRVFALAQLAEELRKAGK